MGTPQSLHSLNPKSRHLHARDPLTKKKHLFKPASGILGLYGIQILGICEVQVLGVTSNPNLGFYTKGKKDVMRGFPKIRGTLMGSP